MRVVGWMAALGCITALSQVVSAQPGGSETPTASSQQGPAPGANSFVESQAKAAIAAKGFEDVSPLVNDSDGIWRGTARKGPDKFNVSVDYKGHVDAK
jgi:putative membrane protein